MDMVCLVIGMILSFVVGALSSLFGIGGGPLFVPILIYLLNIEDSVAAGTSLVLVIPSGITDLIRHRCHLFRC